jgi:hypothetical protein
MCICSVERMWSKHLGSSAILKNYTKKITNQYGKILPIWGQCYDHNFLRVLPNFGEKIGVFLKNQCYDHNFCKN